MDESGQIGPLGTMFLCNVCAAKKNGTKTERENRRKKISQGAKCKIKSGIQRIGHWNAAVAKFGLWLRAK